VGLGLRPLLGQQNECLNGADVRAPLREAGRSTLALISSHDAAKESNLPSRGVHRSVRGRLSELTRRVGEVLRETRLVRSGTWVFLGPSGPASEHAYTPPCCVGLSHAAVVVVARRDFVQRDADAACQALPTWQRPRAGTRRRPPRLRSRRGRSVRGPRLIALSSFSCKASLHDHRDERADRGACSPRGIRRAQREPG
jgi:hypothetical protein